MASIFLRTFIIYFLIAIALRVMGKRQIGELEVSELVSTLLISEIASLPIADPDIPLLNAIIPLFFILSLEIIISTLKNKSEKLKKLVEGEPVFLVYKGRICRKALSDNRLSINELLCEARLQGVGDIADVNYAILEQNGQISILKKGKDESIARPVIIDGEVKEEALIERGIKKKKLLSEIRGKGVSLDEIMLLTRDDEGKYNYYMRENEKNGS